MKPEDLKDLTVDELVAKTEELMNVRGIGEKRFTVTITETVTEAHAANSQGRRSAG